MEWKEFILQENDSGRRLDRVLRRILPHKTSPQIYSALRKGLVKINGKKAAQNYTTQKGDALCIAKFLLEDSAAQNENSPQAAAIIAQISPPAIEFKIEFKNEHLLFFNKPRGVPVHGKGSLTQMAAAQFPPNSLSFRTGPLHRLDKDTTGLVAFSVSLEGAKWFSENIKAHKIKKYYLGIALGRLEKSQTWSEPIDAKDAVTIATPLAFGAVKGKDITFVEYQILTGRKHQIRIHSAEHRHPLLGDERHGAERVAGVKSFFLHAYKMEFPQNPLGLPPFLKAAMPEEFAAFLRENFH